MSTTSLRFARIEHDRLGTVPQLKAQTGDNNRIVGWVTFVMKIQGYAAIQRQQGWRLLPPLLALLHHGGPLRAGFLGRGAVRMLRRMNPAAAFK